MESKGKSKILVVGSCMIDFVCYAPRLPKEGETIHGSKFVTTFGGKGANQCVAAAKLGGSTALVARVGDDLWGDRYINNLKEINVDAGYVLKTLNTTSGIAQITVSEDGKNQIVIVPGANSLLTIKDVEDAKETISSADVVACQLETPPEVAIKTLELCKGISILNGAPAISSADQKLFTLPSIFCVNESEASIFTGLPVENIEEAKIAAEALVKKGCNKVVLTLGSQGALYASKDNKIPVHIPSETVKCVDSTGAGDAFIGALMFLMAYKQKLTMEEKIRAACFIASDSVTRPGTQISFPGPDILEKCKIDVGCVCK